MAGPSTPANGASGPSNSIPFPSPVVPPPPEPEPAPVSGRSPAQPEQSRFTLTDESPSPPRRKSVPRAAVYDGSRTTKAPHNAFSRSAAKRDSVMALGSIQHLQNMYAKHGLASREKPAGLMTRPGGLVLALGPGAALSSHTGLPPRSSPTSLTPSNPPIVELPPTPVAPPASNHPSFPSINASLQTDPEILRPGVVRDVADVRAVWAFTKDGGDVAESEEEPVDVLGLLKTTTAAIRSVQNYMLALPADDIPHTAACPTTASSPTSPSSSKAPKGLHKRSPTLRSISYAISTASRHLSLPTTKKSRRSYSGGTSSLLDPLAIVRRRALDVLSALQDIEERMRLEPSTCEYHPSTSHHPHHSHLSPAPAIIERSATPAGRSSSAASSFSDDDERSFVSTHFTGTSTVATHYTGSGKPVVVWSDDDSFSINALTSNEESGERNRERWEERLVLGNGFLYRSDVRVRRDLEKERAVVKRYLDLVDSILADTGAHMDAPASGAARNGRRVSDGVVGIGRPKSPSAGGERELDTLSEGEGEEDEGDDAYLPEWARRDAFAGEPLARLHALLLPHLPPDLSPLLPAPSDRHALLERLSDGQFICLAFNAVLRRSRRPWGFIPSETIHDIVGLEREEKQGGAAKGGWMFRRVENLRVWAAALKLRYLVSLAPSILPSLPLHISVPTASSSSSTNGFDAKVIARREQGWEDMLESGVLQWVDAVVRERKQQGNSGRMI